ncbi:group II truncated hemoglobin [Sedimentitalea todarodis]|uniref:Group II truncated hemoglobin n=1 Tax=Sedimentitalea todarodis TaxID=1631240 RepID=A0ABU3VGE3_9RHOB|nr:group II truncated hemoglobin [Sedimentitalea todarodis]MDU9005251.1 group II truncated hemoglobin [Sedimentitalea todarodis]
MTKPRVIDHIGGEDGLRKLVNDFYDIVESIPEGQSLRMLHARGHGIPLARTELFDFLSGFMGGRRHYMEKHGHMDIRLIHAHVPIGPQDAEDWLTCMDGALAMNRLDDPEIDRLRAVFRRLCLMLVNDLAAWGMPSEPAQSPGPRS